MNFLLTGSGKNCIISFFFSVYSRPFRPITASTISFHVSLCSASSSLFITPNILISFLTLSCHRCLGLPFGQLLFGFHFVMVIKNWSCALQTSSAHLLWFLSVVTILGQFNKAFSSLILFHSYSPHSSMDQIFYTRVFFQKPLICFCQIWWMAMLHKLTVQLVLYNLIFVLFLQFFRLK